jgi:hypothetical protein
MKVLVTMHGPPAYRGGTQGTAVLTLPAHLASVCDDGALHVRSESHPAERPWVFRPGKWTSCLIEAEG